jgi:hypothetical protein
VAQVWITERRADVDSVLTRLRQATDVYEQQKRTTEEGLLARNAIIVEAALTTTLSYEEIGEAAGISLSGVWKVCEAAGISRQRVRQPRAAGAG